MKVTDRNIEKTEKSYRALKNQEDRWAVWATNGMSGDALVTFAPPVVIGRGRPLTESEANAIAKALRELHHPEVG